MLFGLCIFLSFYHFLIIGCILFVQDIAAACHNNPFKSAASIADDLGLQCCPQTVRNRIYTDGLHGRKPAVKGELTAHHMEARMEYSLEYADKPATFWDRVVFCDEKTFSTDDPAATQYVWRTPTTRLRHPT